MSSMENIWRAMVATKQLEIDKLKRKIKVRNFERIEGNFNFPNGFEPLRVLVDLQQHDKEKLRLHRVFEWHVGEN